MQTRQVSPGAAVAMTSDGGKLPDRLCLREGKRILYTIYIYFFLQQSQQGLLLSNILSLQKTKLKSKSYIYSPKRRVASDAGVHSLV